jgi:osmoprotectant transport system permease protein
MRLGTFLALCLGSTDAAITVGSKKFTESYVLGEIGTMAIRRAGLSAQQKQGMGGTIILWEALQRSAIDLYPEYTGTITEEILKASAPLDDSAVRARLKEQGIGMTRDLGFNNTYALVMRPERSRELGITKISQLRDHTKLRIGLSHEFLDRKDGWRPLNARYALALPDVRGLDHGLGYAALASSSIDLTDAYSTDARIAEDHLVVLEDDLHFFPQYQAVYLYRLGLDSRAVKSLEDLAGTINEARMARLNAEAERTKDYGYAANLYFGGKSVTPAYQEVVKIGRATIQHLELVGISLLFAVLVGIPLGIRASRPGVLSQVILTSTGLIQTIPSLALLALLVPLPFFGITARTAIFALFLYSLLPIVRNTASGLQDLAGPIRESAAALGLEPRAQLRKIFLPLTSRTILAGIKTSAVINVGTATLAALIGAGGLGEPIISGLNLNDNATILEGAIPAALLALVIQFAFDGLERFVIPKGLRLKR